MKLTAEQRARWEQEWWYDGHGRRHLWPLSDVPEIKATQLEVGPGKCPFCEERLDIANSRRTPIICNKAECVKEYHRAYQSKPSRVAYRKRLDRIRYTKLAAARVKAGLTVKGHPRIARWKDRKPL